MKTLCPLEARLLFLWVACMFLPWLTEPKDENWNVVEYIDSNITQADWHYIRARMPNGQVSNLFYKVSDPMAPTYDTLLHNVAYSLSSQGTNLQVKVIANSPEQITALRSDTFSIWNPFEYFAVCWYFFGLIVAVRYLREERVIEIGNIPKLLVAAFVYPFHFRWSEFFRPVTSVVIAPKLIPPNRRLDF